MDLHSMLGALGKERQGELPVRRRPHMLRKKGLDGETESLKDRKSYIFHELLAASAAKEMHKRSREYVGC